MALLLGIGFFKNKQFTLISNPLPLILLMLFAVYQVLNGFINAQGGINLRHYIILVDALLIFSYCILLKKGSINLLAISVIITVVAIIESIVCILQQFGLLASQDTLFKVTGTNVNPNVTAMFLAMGVPALLFLLFNSSKRYRFGAIASIILSLFALVLLQCRTAFIGATVCTLFIINHKYQLLNKLKSKFNKTGLIFCVTFVSCLITYAFIFLYHSKQASSDGRMFIWKISLESIVQKPIFGSGYGQFEHDYNLAQANYFATKTATQQEIYNASYVRMSYNEFLENLFEGGIIGLILFAGLLGTLLLYVPSQLGETKPQNSTSNLFEFGVFAYAGIVTFTIMCFFNFTVQALPVRTLFVLYASVCCLIPPQFQNKINFKSKLLSSKNKQVEASFYNGNPFKIGITTLSLFLFFKLLTLSKAYNQCKTMLDSESDLSSNETLKQMAALEDDLKQSPNYLHGYAKLLFEKKYYDEAIKKYYEALNFSSNPDLYMSVGNCNTRMGKYSEAIKAYSMAQNIEPHRFTPRFASMKLYAFIKDTGNAFKLAKEIVALKPKVASSEIVYFKKEALAYTNSLTLYNKNK